MEQIQNDGFLELKVNFDEFIDLLKPDNRDKLKSYFKGSNGDFVFRGQSDSEYDLLPSLFRSDAEYSYFAGDFSNYCSRQFEFLKLFVQGCDLSGVQIPSDSYEFRDKYLKDFLDINFKDTRTWPNRELYELLGFAQHYGYPTEFLDWTYNALVACYFAASDVVSKKEVKRDASMSVWVFDREKIHSLNDCNKDYAELIDIPRSLNINISAQEGCFLLIRQNLFREQKITYNKEKSRINEVKTLIDLMSERKQSGLLKITISSMKAPKILKFCNEYRINAATLFRTAEGAARYAIDSMNRNRFIHEHDLNRRGLLM